MPTLRLGWALIACLCVAGPAARAEEGPLSGSLTVTSDYLSRGVSQTQHRPAAQVDLEYAHRSGAYVGLWASNVDYTPVGGPTDGVDHEIAGRAGWRVPVMASQVLDLSIEHIRYPGATDGLDFDYTEIGAALEVGEHVALRVVHASDYFGLGGAATDYGVDGAWTLGRYDLLVSLGYYDQRDLVADGYGYVDLSAGREFGAIRVEAGVSRTFGYSDALAEVNGEQRLAQPQARVAVVMSF